MNNINPLNVGRLLLRKITRKYKTPESLPSQEDVSFCNFLFGLIEERVDDIVHIIEDNTLWYDTDSDDNDEFNEEEEEGQIDEAESSSQSSYAPSPVKRAKSGLEQRFSMSEMINISDYAKTHSMEKAAKRYAKCNSKTTVKSIIKFVESGGTRAYKIH